MCGGGILPSRHSGGAHSERSIISRIKPNGAISLARRPMTTWFRPTSSPSPRYDHDHSDLDQQATKPNKWREPDMVMDGTISSIEPLRNLVLGIEYRQLDYGADGWSQTAPVRHLASVCLTKNRSFPIISDNSPRHPQTRLQLSRHPAF